MTKCENLVNHCLTRTSGFFSKEHIFLKALLNFFEDNLHAVKTSWLFPTNLHGDRTWCYLLVLPGWLWVPGKGNLRKANYLTGKKKTGREWVFGIPYFFLAKMREGRFYLPTFHRESFGEFEGSKGQIWEFAGPRRLGRYPRQSIGVLPLTTHYPHVLKNSSGENIKHLPKKNIKTHL